MKPPAIQNKFAVKQPIPIDNQPMASKIFSFITC